MNKQIPKLANQETCCGCSACYAVCPKQAICMVADTEGFLQPVIDEELCSRCGSCESVCPALYPGQPREPLAVYVAKAKDDILRMKSSSGGIFSLFAREVFLQGGIVYGAGWERPTMRVIHKSAENESELEELRGSKYVQSDMGDIFNQIKDQLCTGRLVLFSGCPCQVLGLTLFLQKAYPNLLTLEIVCNSVPSPLVFKKFIEWLLEKRTAPLKNISFRDKSRGWHIPVLSVNFRQTQINSPLFESYYGQLWLPRLSIRRSCCCCPGSRFRSMADISLSDAWGLENYAPDFDDDKGTSLIYVHKKTKMISKIFGMTENREVKLESVLFACPGINREELGRASVDWKKRDYLFKQLINSRFSFPRIVRKTLGMTALTEVYLWSRSCVRSLLRNMKLR